MCVWRRERDWRRVSLFYFTLTGSAWTYLCFFSLIYIFHSSVSVHVHKWLTKKCLLALSCWIRHLLHLQRHKAWCDRAKHVHFYHTVISGKLRNRDSMRKAILSNWVLVESEWEKRGESTTVSAYVDNLAESDGLPWLQNTKRRCSMEDNQKQTHTHRWCGGVDTIGSDYKRLTIEYPREKDDLEVERLE